MDATDSPPAPVIAPAVFDRLDSAFETDGAIAAVDRLCEELIAAGDFQNLFYARLMRKRIELGVSPFPTGPAADLPPETHDAYEDAIRAAGREAGGLYLDRGDIPKAWTYFRMLGEPEPVRTALRNYRPGPEDDIYPVVEVAWQQLVLPEKGFDLILDGHGVCSAITMVQSADLSQNAGLKTYCVNRLIHALYDQLLDRLRGDLHSRGVEPPAGLTVGRIVAEYPGLFGEDVYHVDTSHLSSVVQMAMQLQPGPELDLARELAAYGERLSPALRGSNDPPFDDTFADYRVFLDVLAGHEVDGGLAHFRRKADDGARDGYAYPAEVLVNLLVKVGREREALEVAKQHLADADERNLSCPGVTALARSLKDFATLAAAARDRDDPVQYLAGLIAAGRRE